MSSQQHGSGYDLAIAAVDVGAVLIFYLLDFKVAMWIAAAGAVFFCITGLLVNNLGDDQDDWLDEED